MNEKDIIERAIEWWISLMIVDMKTIIHMYGINKKWSRVTQEDILHMYKCVHS